MANEDGQIVLDDRMVIGTCLKSQPMALAINFGNVVK